jgi:hypothetical protein
MVYMMLTELYGDRDDDVNLLLAARLSPPRETRGFASSPHGEFAFFVELATISTNLGLVNTVSRALNRF